MKKIISILLSMIILVCSFLPQMAFANESTVTDAMCQASYWKEKTLVDADKVLLDFKGIAKVNQDAIDGAGTKVFDLTKIAETYNADKSRESLAKELEYNASDSYRARAIWIDGVKIDNETYFNNLAATYKSTCYTGTQNTQYAVCSEYAELISYPIVGFLGWSEHDTDDEKVNCGLLVNEPVVIRQKCKNNGKLFYYCQSTNCSGWVDSESLALCKDKAEWLDAWQVKLDAKDFIVIAQDKLTLENSDITPQVANTKITLGTILKLVPQNEIPKNLGERGDWHNYVVYFPVRNPDGTYKKDMALIAKHYNISLGFLPLTQSNLLDIAFSCLGNRYGWAGMLEAMDCSLYTRTIYRCFGYELPRNTSWQPMVPHIKVDMSTMNDAQKEAFIETCPAGTLLYFTGHTMVYIGSENGKNYVISATGSLSDSQGDLDVKSMYTVIINPLTARRKSGNTWLHDMHTAVLPMGMTDINDCNIVATKNAGENDSDANVVVKLGDKELIEDINYTVAFSNGKATVTGIKNFNSSKDVTITVLPSGGAGGGAPIPAPEETISVPVTALSQKSFTYDGKAKTPDVVVKDNLGNIIDKSNYTVRYTDNINVGTATAIVTFNDKGMAPVKMNFRINPAGLNAPKLTAKKNGFKAKWTKKTTQTTGYQIQYSTNSKFINNVTTKTISNNKTNYKTITKLKANKKYYVRVRAYKLVGKTKYYSSWSTAKVVKTK